MKRIWGVGFAAAMVSMLATAVMVAPSGAATGATVSAGCTPKTNIEAIIDDSGSMSFTDEVLISMPSRGGDEGLSSTPLVP